MDDDKNSGIEHVGDQRRQVKMEQFEVAHFLCNDKSKPQKQPLDESFKPKHASINPKPKDSKDDTKK
ncbi:hypothetical protein [Helicobacter pylori]|uniref:hypothetical protein n=1 Tax=Helicobacter pylori TaxID=210 RepID=UPI000D38C525|nr:hypothetical protein [Helicobacter pylori]PUD02513.1 hypothetical protein C2S01_08085 [Helicobacter pylori]